MLNRKQAVAAHLEQHARQEDRPGRRRLDVGQRQPGVEREHRHLDREAGQEQQEDQHLRAASSESVLCHSRPRQMRPGRCVSSGIEKVSTLPGEC